jgi:RNA methyltransferase, TrmH family
MELIDSPQNNFVKLFRALATPKGRQEHHLFAVEGIHAIRALLESGLRARIAYICPQLLEDEELARALAAVSESTYEFTTRAFTSLSDTVTPQGIAAAVALPKRTGIRHLAQDRPGVYLAVHELRDPGNMGTMIRSAHAAGALGVIAVGDCVDFYNPKVVRATTGSIFFMEFAECQEHQLVNFTEQMGATLVAASAHGEVSCAELDWPQRAVILIGNEAHGLPESLLTAAHIRVKIPMPGRAESLNAAVAAGILLYEFNRPKL